MNNKIKIKQQDITDCGAASLASICAFYGLQYPIAKIRQYAYTDKNGTNIIGMINAAKKLGFTAKGVKAKLEALNMIPIPAVAHVVINKTLQHFIVIYKVENSDIIYMDPADGDLHKISIKDFAEIWTGVLVLLEPSETFVKGNLKESNFSRFIRLLSPHKSILIQAIFGALICSVLGLSTSFYVGKITDYVIVDGNINLLNIMSVGMILILIIRVFINSMKSLLALKTGQRIDASLILGYYKHIMKLPQQFFDTMRVGEIISRVNDAVKIRTFINDISIELIVNLMVVGVTTIVMLLFSWKLTIIVVVSGPIFGLLYYIYNRCNKKYLRKIMEKSAELESHLVESLNSIITIKRFSLESFANLKTESHFVRLLRETFSASKKAIFVEGGITFVSSGLTIVTLWIGSNLVVHKDLTPGTLIMFYSMIGYIISPLQYLITSNQKLQDANIAADRLFQIMDLETEQSQKDNILLNSNMIGDITFENVCFSYGTRSDVFNNLNLVIPKGEITAIVGESGSGKTTLSSLILNIYPIKNGCIRIGDYDVSQISNTSLRQHIGTVPQQIELFKGNILENIAIGDYAPNIKQVHDIIRELGLDDFIKKLPQGLQTQIGEHGVSLSGGERQRIAIARALYRSPDIIIFDEATSSLDSISEKYIKNTIQRLSNLGKTVITIAHRLSTIKDSNNILVLNHGQLAECGTHSQLLKNNGIYRKLWNGQFDDVI